MLCMNNLIQTRPSGGGSHLEEVCASQGPSLQGCVPTVPHAEHLHVFDELPRLTAAELGVSVKAGLDLGAATTRVYQDVLSAVSGSVLDAPGFEVDTPSVLAAPLFSCWPHPACLTHLIWSWPHPVWRAPPSHPVGRRLSFSPVPFVSPASLAT